MANNQQNQNSGNFAKDRDRASQANQKPGQVSGGKTENLKSDTSRDSINR